MFIGKLKNYSKVNNSKNNKINKKVIDMDKLKKISNRNFGSIQKKNLLIKLIERKSFFNYIILKTFKKIKDKRFLRHYMHLFGLRIRKLDNVEKIDESIAPATQRAVQEIKNQRLIRRKRYKILTLYRRYRHNLQNRNTRPSKLAKSVFNVKMRGINRLRFHYTTAFLLKRIFRFFYGFLHNRIWNKIIKKGLKKKNRFYETLKLLEYRLEVFLYRCHFAESYLQSRQFIRHGLVYVNGNQVRSKHYVININDIISIDKARYFSTLILNKSKYVLEFLENEKELFRSEIFETYIVDYRILHAIIIKKTTRKKNYLMKQFPSAFFGKNAIHMYRVNFHKLRRKSHFTGFLNQQRKQRKKEERNAKRFETLMQDLLQTDLYTIPKRNLKIVLSFHKLM